MNEKAQKIIETAIREKKTSLELVDCELKELPDLSAMQNSLYSLNLHNNQLTDISRIKTLKNLRQLNLRDNFITDISPLSDLRNLNKLYVSDNKVKDISPLGKIRHLKILVANGNAIENIDLISGMSDLTTASFVNNKLSGKINFYIPMQVLKSLYLGNNQIRDISFLKNTPFLTKLYLNDNQIENIDSISALDRLEFLDLRNNIIQKIEPLKKLIAKQLPIDAKRQFFNPSSDNASQILIAGNQLDNTLQATIQQGNEAILNYLDLIQLQNPEKINEAKLMIVGEPRAGKTSLRKKLQNVDAILPSATESTKGVYIDKSQCEFTVYDKELKKEMPFHYHIWDFGGQEVYKPISQLFITKSSLYVIVINSDLNENDKELDFWFETIEKLSGGSPVIILENTPTDRKEPKDISGIEKQYRRMWKGTHLINLRRLSTVANPEDFNPETLREFENLRQLIHDNLERLPHTQSQVPASWAGIRRDIAKRTAVTNFISLNEYIQICNNNKLDEKYQMQLSETFHILGTFLHFQNNKELKDLIILNDKWAINAVYCALDCDLVKRQNGKFDKSQIKEVWSGALYDGMRDKIVELLKEFKLCYQIDNSDTFIIPHCLPLYHTKEWDFQKNLRLSVKYNFLPRATVVQLLVELHRYIADGQEWIWQKGGVIDGSKCNTPNTWARIEQRDDLKTIEIRLRGMMPQNLMTYILTTIEKINERYPDLKIDKLIPCNCSHCLSSDTPQYFGYEEHLIDHLYIKKLNEIYCLKTARKINIRNLLLDFFTENTLEEERKKHADEFAAVDWKDTALDHIKNGDLKEAINLIDSNYNMKNDKENANDYILLSGQFINNNRQKELGFIDYDKYNQELHRITLAITQLVKKM